MAEKEKKQSVQTIQTKTRVEKGKSKADFCRFYWYYHTVDPVAVWLSDRGIHVSAGQDVFHRFCREGGSSYSCYLLNK